MLPCLALSKHSKSIFSQFPIFVLTLLSLSLALLLSAAKVYSGQATLSWDAPTTNADGTPLTDLNGYNVHYGITSGNYSQVIDVGNVTTYTVASLTDGTYYFAVTAYDTSGNESNYSNEISKTIQSVQQYTLSITKAGTGTGTVTATGINCGSDCTEIYNQGTIVTLSTTPATGSTFAGWSGGGCTGTGTCSISINSNTTITANFNKNTYTIAATAGAGGSISPSGSVTVNQGASQTFTITPTTGYHITDVKADGTSVGAVSTYTFSNVTANHSIEATFATNTYTIAATAGTGGSISPSGSVTMNQGASQTFTIAPDLNYSVSDVNVDGSSIGSVLTYTFNNVTSSHAISVSFTALDYDSDGIPDFEEQGPQSNNPNYDGNNDGIPDYLQSNAASFHTLDRTNYEDAEDGTIKGWDIYDNNPLGANITNVYDYDRMGRVIQLTGYGWDNGYRLRKDDMSTWNNSTQFVIEWSMEYSEDFNVYIDVETTAGHRYIYYRPDDYNNLGTGEYIHHGLGSWAIDGEWHTFARDLQADLQEAQPGVTVLTVNGFLIRGSGRVDDIKLRDPSYITLFSPDGYPLSNVTVVQVPQGAPLEATFPYDFVAFEVNNLPPGAGTNIIIKLPEGTSINSYYKYGPTPEDPTPRFYSFLFDGQTGAEISGNVVTLHFIDGLTGDGDLTVNGQILDQGGPATIPDIKYTITATAGSGGAISPCGAISVNQGSSQTFTITPNNGGYSITNVKVDGTSVGAVSAYTFNNVTANHTIEASFAKIRVRGRNK